VASFENFREKQIFPCRIIPFVAADAVSDEKPKEKVTSQEAGTVEVTNPQEGVQALAGDPDIQFSPPQATEGKIGRLPT